MFELELNKVMNKIKEINAKKVLIQLPEGLKPKSDIICDTIEKETGITCLIWAGSCFGACDVPKVEVDLVVQWGHTEMI